MNEIDIRNQNSIAFTSSPTLPARVEYTMTMAIFVENITYTNRNILENTNANPEYQQPNTRRPLIYISGTSATWAKPNSICVEHYTDQDYQVGVCSDEPVPTGSYFNFAFTVSNENTLRIYVDNEEKGTVSTPTANTFTWAPTNTWVFGNSSFTPAPDAGALKIKNVYFYDSVYSPAFLASYISTTSRASCTSCPAHTYNANLGSRGPADCTPCPTNTQFIGTKGTSSSVCTPCPAGAFSVSGSACVQRGPTGGTRTPR
jgi:hypothetical protein